MRQIISEHEMRRLATNLYRRGTGFACIPLQGEPGMFIFLTYECEEHPNYSQQFEVKDGFLTGEMVCEKCEAEKRKRVKEFHAIHAFKQGSGVQPLLAEGP